MQRFYQNNKEGRWCRWKDQGMFESTSRPRARNVAATDTTTQFILLQATTRFVNRQKRKRLVTEVEFEREGMGDTVHNDSEFVHSLSWYQYGEKQPRQGESPQCTAGRHPNGTCGRLLIACVCAGASARTRAGHAARSPAGDSELPRDI